MYRKLICVQYIWSKQDKASTKRDGITYVIMHSNQGAYLYVTKKWAILNRLEGLETKLNSFLQESN